MIKTLISVVKSVSKYIAISTGALGVATYCFFQMNTGYFDNNSEDETGLRLKINNIINSTTMSDEMDNIRSLNTYLSKSNVIQTESQGLAVEYGSLTEYEKQYLRDIYDIIEQSYIKLGVSKDDVPPEALYFIPACEGHMIEIGNLGYIAPDMVSFKPVSYEKGFTAYTVNNSNCIQAGGSFQRGSYYSVYQFSDSKVWVDFNSGTIKGTIKDSDVSYFPDMCISELYLLNETAKELKSYYKNVWDSMPSDLKVSLFFAAHNRGSKGASLGLPQDTYDIWHNDMESFKTTYYSASELAKTTTIKNKGYNNGKPSGKVLFAKLWFLAGAESSTNFPTNPIDLLKDAGVWEDSFSSRSMTNKYRDGTPQPYFSNNSWKGAIAKGSDNDLKYKHDFTSATYITQAYLMCTYYYYTLEYILSKEFPGEYISSYSVNTISNGISGQYDNSWGGNFIPAFYYAEHDLVNRGTTDSLLPEAIFNLKNSSLTANLTNYTTTSLGTYSAYIGKYNESGWRGNTPIMAQTSYNSVGQIKYWNGTASNTACSVYSAYSALVTAGLTKSVPSILSDCINLDILDIKLFMTKVNDLNYTPLTSDCMSKLGYQITKFSGTTSQGQADIISTVKQGYPVVVNFAPPSSSITAMDNSGNRGKATLQSGSSGHYMVIINTYEKDGVTWIDVCDSRVSNAGKGINDVAELTDVNRVSLNWDEIISKKGLRGDAYTIVGISGSNSTQSLITSNPLQYYNSLKQGSNLVLTQQATVEVINKNKIKIYLNSNEYIEVQNCNTSLTGTQLLNSGTIISSTIPSSDKIYYIQKQGDKIVSNIQIEAYGKQ